MCVLLRQYRSPDGSPPMPVALKVIDCSEDDACSFERVYNEVRAETHNHTLLCMLADADCVFTQWHMPPPLHSMRLGRSHEGT